MSLDNFGNKKLNNQVSNSSFLEYYPSATFYKDDKNLLTEQDIDEIEVLKHVNLIKESF